MSRRGRLEHPVARRRRGLGSRGRRGCRCELVGLVVSFVCIVRRIEIPVIVDIYVTASIAYKVGDRRYSCPTNESQF